MGGEERTIVVSRDELKTLIREVREELREEHDEGNRIGGEDLKALMREAIREELGPVHEEEHRFIGEFMTWWMETKRSVWQGALRSTLGVILLAFAAGMLLLARTAKLP